MKTKNAKLTTEERALLRDYDNGVTKQVANINKELVYFKKVARG